MKIAFFSDNFYPELSGISDSIILTGTKLAERGHTVVFFAPKYSNKNYRRSNVSREEPHLGKNIKIRRIFSLPFPAPTLQGRLAIPNILRGILMRKFDIIHTQSFFGTGLDALIASDISGVPLVGTNHTLIEPFAEYSPIAKKTTKNILVRYMKWYYNKCIFVTTPSEFLKNDMSQKGVTTPMESVSNPIADEFFSSRDFKEALKQKLGLSKFTILYAGRISPEKNIQVLLDAFIPFAKENSNVNLSILGDGSLKKELEKKAAESGVSRQIKFEGSFFGKNKQTLYDHFHASDCFVMPSTSETQSMGVLQAMAAKVPVIVANSGPLPKLVLDKKGLLFEPNNAVDLTTRFNELYKNSNLGIELSQNASVLARELSADKIATQWEKIYNRIISDHS